MKAIILISFALALASTMKVAPNPSRQLNYEINTWITDKVQIWELNRELTDFIQTQACGTYAFFNITRNQLYSMYYSSPEVKRLRLAGGELADVFDRKVENQFLKWDSAVSYVIDNLRNISLGFVEVNYPSNFAAFRELIYNFNKVPESRGAQENGKEDNRAIILPDDEYLAMYDELNEAAQIQLDIENETWETLDANLQGFWQQQTTLQLEWEGKFRRLS